MREMLFLIIVSSFFSIALALTVTNNVNLEQGFDFSPNDQVNVNLYGIIEQFSYSTFLHRVHSSLQCTANATNASVYYRGATSCIGEGPAYSYAPSLSTVEKCFPMQYLQFPDNHDYSMCCPRASDCAVENRCVPTGTNRLNFCCYGNSNLDNEFYAGVSMSNCNYYDLSGNNDYCYDTTTNYCYYYDGDTCTGTGWGNNGFYSVYCYEPGSEVGNSCYYDMVRNTPTNISDDCDHSGCSISVDNHPTCVQGDFNSSGADCEADNYLGDGVDYCMYNSGDACLQDNDGWDYSNSSTIGGYSCSTCAVSGQGYYYNNPADVCYSQINCSMSSGWSGTLADCDSSGEIDVSGSSPYTLKCYYYSTGSSDCDSTGCHISNESFSNCNYTNFAVEDLEESEASSGYCLDDNNNLCYYNSTDVCADDSDGFDWASVACYEAGREVGDDCYYDSTPANLSDDCTSAGCVTSYQTHALCVDGDFTSSGANCEVDNYLGDTVDYCMYNNTDSCAVDSDGWDYSNSSAIGAYSCHNCTRAGYGSEYSDENDDCYYDIVCNSTSGWQGVLNDDCDGAGELNVSGSTIYCFYWSGSNFTDCWADGCHEAVESKSCNYTNLVTTESAGAGYCLDDVNDLCYYSSSNVCGVDNDGFDWSVMTCQDEGTLFWNTTDYEKSLCYGDLIESNSSAPRQDDCSSNGCTIGVTLESEAASEGVSAMVTCINSGSVKQGCGDSSCDNNSDEYYCCSGANCYIASCDANNSWEFETYNVSIYSPVSNYTIYRSSCSSPYSALLRVNVSDSQGVVNSSISINTVDGLCSMSFDNGSYCNYNPSDDRSVGYYPWNVTYWRGQTGYSVIAGSDLNISGCLSGSIVSPSQGAQVFRSACYDPNTLLFNLSIVDELSAPVSGVSVNWSVNGTSESCSFSKYGDYYNCTYNPSNSLPVNTYTWYASFSKPYYTSSYLSRNFDAMGCLNVSVFTPLNNSNFDVGDIIDFNVSILMDNLSYMSGAYVNVSLVKPGVVDYWILSDNGTYDSIAYDNYYGNNYSVAGSNLGFWNISYLSQNLSYYYEFFNFSSVRADDVVINVNFSGDTQFLLVNGTAVYYTGGNVSCSSCATINITDSNSTVHSYATNVSNGVVSYMVTDKPLRAGVNYLQVFVDDSIGFNGSSSVVNVALNASISVFNSDSDKCLDGSNGQDLNYTVQVFNTGSVGYPFAKLYMNVYKKDNSLLGSVFSLPQEINVGSSANYSIALQFNGTEDTADRNLGIGYGAHFFIKDSSVNSGLDIIANNNVSSDIERFSLWRITNVNSAFSNDSLILPGGETLEYNVSAKLDKGVGSPQFMYNSVSCSSSVLTYSGSSVKVNCSSCIGECANFTLLSETGSPLAWFPSPLLMDSVSSSEFETAYSLDECGNFKFIFNISEASDCGLYKVVEYNPYYECRIFVNEFKVSNSELTQSTSSDKTTLVDVNTDALSFTASVIDAVDIYSLDNAVINIFDESGIDRGAGYSNVGNLSNPVIAASWSIVGGEEAVWFRTHDPDDLRCGEYDVNIFVNNSYGLNDSFSSGFILDRFIANVDYSSSVIIGSNNTVSGVVSSCSHKDNAAYKLNLSSVSGFFTYLNGSNPVLIPFNITSDGGFSFNYTAPIIETTLSPILTKFIFNSTAYSTCTVNCGLELIVPVTITVYKTPISISPLSKAFNAGEGGEDSYVFEISNPTSGEVSYELKLASDRIGCPLVFSDNLDSSITLTLKPGELFVGYVDALPIASGVYSKKLLYTNLDDTSDSGSVDFESRVNVAISNVIFTYFVVPDLGLLSALLLFLVAGFILYRKF